MKKQRITTSGNFPRPGQHQPAVIVLSQPKRFGIDTADFRAAITAAENPDFSRRTKLYDLYNDILLDAHLSSVIEKRRNAVLCSDIEFLRDGVPDPQINEQIKSPWFNSLITDLLDSKFWGFTLLQFYRDERGWISYDLIPRKHVDPIRRHILHRQSDLTGTPWDNFSDILFVGSTTDLGLLLKAAPWVIYKRNTTSDWAQFSEVFGMPTREFVYDTDDEEARARAIEDANSLGSLASFIHGKDTELKLIEAGNKTGSADVYERLCERCNNEISKLILGNTLTTEASDRGTQALGTVHKKIEDRVSQADRLFILDILNYDMADIFSAMGINTSGGRFSFNDAAERFDVDMETRINILTQLSTTFHLPIDDDYLYEEFGIDKPADYDQLKEALLLADLTEDVPTPSPDDVPTPSPGDDEGTPSPDGDTVSRGSASRAQRPTGRLRRAINALRRFFVPAPHRRGATLEW